MDYLEGSSSALRHQVDVLLVLPGGGGEGLPAHSQFLARSCGLFSELLEATAGVQDGAGGSPPSAAAPLRVEVPASVAGMQAARQFLQAVYHPHQTPAILAQLTSAPSYGALLDMAAFAHHGALLAALMLPLAARSVELGVLVGWDFVPWLDVSER